jgi:hypothetical protein
MSFVCHFIRGGMLGVTADWSNRRLVKLFLTTRWYERVFCPELYAHTANIGTLHSFHHFAR